MVKTLVSGATFPADTEEFPQWFRGWSSQQSVDTNRPCTSSSQPQIYCRMKAQLNLFVGMFFRVWVQRYHAQVVHLLLYPIQVKAYFLAHILIIYFGKCSLIQALYSLCSSCTQTWRHQGGGSSRRLSDSECFPSSAFSAILQMYIWKCAYSKRHQYKLRPDIHK